MSYGIFATIALLTAKSLHKNDYNIGSYGIVRISRSAWAVYEIAKIYNREFYKKSENISDVDYDVQLAKAHKMAAERLLKLICLNRGIYIKAGQHIGALEYLLPKEYIDTMKVLYSNAPQNSIEEVFKVIQEELKKSPDDIFEYFDKKPLGTASLAQVHKAILKNGQIVAVKVQHPYVKCNAKVDLICMEILMNIMAYIYPDFKVKWLFDESKKNLPAELDFINEAYNTEQVAKHFKKYSWLKIPNIKWEFSTSRVLVMDFLEGACITDLNYMKNHNINRYDVSNKLGQLYSEMIFNTGFVHSDPHPGNIMVKKNNKNSVDIILLDHGLYAKLTDDFRYTYSKLWLSILKVDKESMQKYAHNLGIKDNLYRLFVCMITGRPWKMLERGIDKIKYTEEEV